MTEYLKEVNEKFKSKEELEKHLQTLVNKSPHITSALKENFAKAVLYVYNTRTQAVQPIDTLKDAHTAFSSIEKAFGSARNFGHIAPTSGEIRSKTQKEKSLPRNDKIKNEGLKALVDAFKHSKETKKS